MEDFSGGALLGVVAIPEEMQRGRRWGRAVFVCVAVLGLFLSCCCSWHCCCAGQEWQEGLHLQQRGFVLWRKLQGLLPGERAHFMLAWEVLECLRIPYGEIHVVSVKYSDVIFYSPQKWCPINHSKVRLLSVLLDWWLSVVSVSPENKNYFEPSA